MDDKQYEIILHHADCCIGDLQDNEEYEMCAAILKDAKRDLAAMRQPITAEALLAAGWRIVTLDLYRCPDKYGDLFLFVEFDNGEPERVTFNTHPFKNCRTMYDLGELVRLLGGAA